MLPAEPLLVRRSASDAKVQEAGQAVVKPRYCKEFATWAMSMKHARLAWRRYCTDRSDIKAISTFKDQDALQSQLVPF